MIELTKTTQEMIDRVWDNEGELYFDIDAMIIYESVEQADEDGVWLCKTVDSKEFDTKEKFIEAVEYIIAHY